MKVTHYKVAWDNGANACDEFPVEFKSEADAKEFGDNWIDEINIVDPVPEGEGYSYDIVEYYEDGTHKLLED